MKPPRFNYNRNVLYGHISRKMTAKRYTVVLHSPTLLYIRGKCGLSKNETQRKRH